MGDEESSFSFSAAGTFQELSYGRVHYLLSAPNGDMSNASELCVCIHGFSTDATIYSELVPKLNAEGYATLCIDLYGRGFSDAAPKDIPNTMSLFTSCISELLYSLSEKTNGLSTKPVTLIGYSMGGAIAPGFARLHPSFVERLILLAPAGLPVSVPLTARLVTAPLIGNMLFYMAGKSSLLKHIGGGYVDKEAEGVPEAIAFSTNKTRFFFENNEGFARSLHSTLQYFDFGGHSDAFEALGQSNKPVLFIWGKDDSVVPHANLEPMMEMVPQAEEMSVDACNHSDLFGNAAIATSVHDRILSFLSSSSQ
eukprot:m.240784 g.240784  ORF g.240784 m.240784 type:complete len:310 (+) comp16030_c0_seq1:57-986(+)